MIRDEDDHIENSDGVLIENQVPRSNTIGSIQNGDNAPVQKESTASTIKYMFWVFCVCFALAGVQFVYSIQFALGTPLFKQKFKLTPSTISIIQSTAGPISGFIIQPIIGVYSDASTSRFGRRRPFILFGSLFCIVGLLSIAFSPQIGVALGDHADGEFASDHKAGLIIAIAGFWIMNLSVNIMQGPTRSLVSDIIEGDKQHLGNSMAVNTMGFASILANIIGSFFSNNSESYRDLFLIGAGFVALSVVPTLIAAKEVQQEDKGTKPKSPIDVFVKIGKGFSTMPKELAIISVVFFVSWFGFSPFMVSETDYFGTNVFPSDYSKGIQFGFYAQACFSASSFFFSFFLSKFVSIFGEKFIYSFTQLTAGACLILFLVFDHPPVWLAMLLTTVVGVNFCVFNSIPYALMVNVISKSDAGLYMGVLNSSAVVSQTISIFTSGRVEAAKNQDTAWAIAYGGLFALVGGVIAWFLPIKKKQAEKVNSNEKTPLLA
ncbi:hypothetical protein CYY_006142 [Polysphondylium violaceum]|uniref:Major facilitator superfamily (MFS) profile domain-containing protein n=1 Tax=Polysphondylium violaceum TaxID=133409 RepID=A0A8J4PT61_9MYCE|nr:hypothetical protein CYY_006142 [Polysphondylium violaceum]